MGNPGERSVGCLPQAQGASLPLGELSWAPPVPRPIPLLLAGIPKAEWSSSSEPTGLGGMSNKRITINKILSNESLVQENQYFQVRVRLSLLFI